MSEINKNLNNIDASKLPPKTEVKQMPKVDAMIPVEQPEKKMVEDFSNPTAEALGRSQVNPAGVSAIAKDVAFGMANPEKIAEADKFYDMAYKVLSEQGDKDAGPKAAAMMDLYVNEFSNR